MSALQRPNRLDIDLAAIGHNLRQVRQHLDPSTRVFAALKADAYGFGLARVADTLVAEGIDAIAVADLSEAVALRKRGLELPLLLYPGNLVDEAGVRALERYRLMPTIMEPGAASRLSGLARSPVKVFVKVDVGLERLGVAPQQAAALVRHVVTLPKLDLEGLYTHVDVPDAPQAEAYIDWQAGRFLGVCAELEERGIAIAVKMMASSGLLRHSTGFGLNAVDPGHLLFGLTPPGPEHVDHALRPVLRSLRSALIHVRAVDRGEFRELAPFALRDNMRIGVMPIGARDGMRTLHCGEVLVGGRRVRILGAISLEHTRLDLSDVPQAAVGDEVVIIGRQGDACIEPAEVMAHQQLSVKAELALAVRDSVHRHYV